MVGRQRRGRTEALQRRRRQRWRLLVLAWRGRGSGGWGRVEQRAGEEQPPPSPPSLRQPPRGSPRTAPPALGASPPIPISRRRSAAGESGAVRLRSGAGGRSDSPVPARRPPSVPTATMNRGGSSPSAATNYLICTNCRKVLRKVRARLGVRLGGALSAGLGSGCSAGRTPGARLKGIRAPSPLRDRKGGRGLRGQR